MQMTPVKSSNVLEVGYDAAGQVLRVRFKSGCYDYLKVPDEIWAQLQHCIAEEASIGAFISMNIVRNFNHIRVEEPK